MVASPSQACDEGLVFQRVEPLLQGGQHLFQVSRQHGRAGEPEAGKDEGAVAAVGAVGQKLVFAISQDVPADFLLNAKRAKPRTA